VRFVGQDGIIRTLAGNGTPSNGAAGPALGVGIDALRHLTVDSNGALYVVDRRFGSTSGGGVIRKIAPGLPGFSGLDIAVPSEDASQLYRFDGLGKHLQTVDTLTGATLFSFGYDAVGRPISITDGDGNVTTIERNANGDPTAIVAPFG